MTTLCVTVASALLVLTTVSALSTTATKQVKKVHRNVNQQQQQQQRVKKTWETIALAPTTNRERRIRLDQKATVFDKELFEEFQTIRGTYFINGLSSCQIGDRLIHPFEAHGFVKSLSFDGDGELHLKTAIVETPLTQRERRFNMPMARGVMSSLASPILNALTSSERDTANLSATLWPPPGTSTKESVLIVAGDNGAPYIVDPKTLETKGKLQDLIPALKGKKLLAHSRIDDKRQRLVLCSSTFGFTSNDGTTTLEYMEFDTDFELVATRTVVNRFMVVHDWMLTDNYYVVPKNPARFRWNNFPKFILGSKLGVDIFEMDCKSVGEIILIPRHDETAPIRECKADSFFTIFHFGPCFEDSDNKVVVHASVFDWYKFGGEMGFNVAEQEFDPIQWSSSEEAPAPGLDKFVIDLEDNAIVKRERVKMVDSSTQEDIPVDLPTFCGDGAPCRYSYFVGTSQPQGWFPFRSIVKTDLQAKESWNWNAGDECIVSEPMFVPRPNSVEEDDGFLLSIIHSATTKSCELNVWDSQQFHRGPIATIDLGELMPWCVHGSWVPGSVY